MKLYKVDLDICIPVVVEADSTSSATDTAHENIKEILNDVMLKDHANFTVWPLPVKKSADLPKGWDTECVPYGGDRNARIKEYLK